MFLGSNAGPVILLAVITDCVLGNERRVKIVPSMRFPFSLARFISLEPKRKGRSGLHQIILAVVLGRSYAKSSSLVAALLDGD